MTVGRIASAARYARASRSLSRSVRLIGLVIDMAAFAAARIVRRPRFGLKRGGMELARSPTTGGGL